MRNNLPHLVWLHSHFLYWMGGTKYIYEVASQLSKNYNITLLVESASSFSSANFRRENLRLVSLKKTTSTSPMYWITFPFQICEDFFKFKKIISEIENNGQKVILISSMFPMNVVAVLLGKPHLQLCYEPFAFFYDPDFTKGFSIVKQTLIKFLAIFLAPLDIWATRESHKILTLNHSTSKYIRQVYGKRPTICYTGIDTNHFKPHISKKMLTKYRGKKVIIHNTDYSPVKGTDRMIKIFKDVRSNNPTSHLLITSTIKDTVAERKLEKLVNTSQLKNSVEFLEFVDYKILPQYYSLAKVLVNCSYSEKSGTTSMALPVKEAMACGTLAIRFPIKGEDVVDGKTGFLVDPRNEKEMINKIDVVLKMNNKIYNRASRDARNFIRKQYTWENTCKIFENEIRKLIFK